MAALVRSRLLTQASLRKEQAAGGAAVVHQVEPRKGRRELHQECALEVNFTLRGIYSSGPFSGVFILLVSLELLMAEWRATVEDFNMISSFLRRDRSELF